MHSEKPAKGQRALHPAQEYCHLCRQKKPAHHRQELRDGQSPPLEPILRSHVWKEYLPLPFPVDLETLDDRAGNHNHHDLQRRQVCLGQSHYTLSESCSPPCYMWREMRVPRWDPWLPSPTCVWERSALAHCGQEVADGRVADRLGRPSDYGYGREWYHHEPPHPLNGGTMLAKVRSQRYYREARNVSEEHHLDCVSEKFHQNRQIPELEWDHRRTFEYNGHCERRHVTFEDHDDGHSIEYNGSTSPIKNHCNGAKAFFSTEVPQSKFTVSKTSGPKLPVSEIYGGETKLDQADRSEVGGSWSDHRKSQETVREQIKQVVTELEDVLSGLKQVQMEMKEVVQQIDVLTSSIDLGEEEQGPFNGLPQESMHQANRIGVVALVHNANRNAESIQSVHMCAGVKSQTSRSLSDHSLAPVISCPESHPTTKIHTNPSSRVHAPMTVESAYSNQMNHTSVLEIQRTKGTANGDCLRARPPRAKVKELQHQKTKTDYTKNPDPPYPLAPISLAKTQRPPPYPQNGLVKVPSKDLNVLKTPPYPGKQKELISTMV
ncbi:uncharacterized protein si:ch211-178n15.1 [Silurus meridionalis]|uniref:Uncharacterized protein n=1 Tax=Silurus meridionalis TaxID=175797 RepID=A0A8T0AIN1_SILME|nr:uncharacterized protein si:ch211-178n15.1 [Silurus meridionalis]KAF7692448.1 hypothetical protein HF521_010058 [Silurus meridionalis]KAI5092725.1 hypothetical protein C0J45_17116 [Silurus meridionalis]